MTQQGVVYTRRDYFKERFTIEELRDLLAHLGLHPADVLSRRSRTYKTLLAGRDADPPDDELLALMVAEPTLLRRPLVVAGDRAVVGFDRAGLAELASAERGTRSAE